MVSQVPIIGILMIVNGVLTFLVGIGVMALGPFTQAILKMQADQGGPAAQPQMRMIMPFLFWYYIALGIVHCSAGLFNVVAGIPAMRYRYRFLAVAALFTNLVTLPACYCAPTSLGLMIWGLIVLFQKDVAEAFRMGAAGASVDEIKRRAIADERRRNDDDDEDRDDRPARRHRGDAGPPGGPQAGDPPTGPGEGQDGIREL